MSIDVSQYRQSIGCFNSRIYCNRKCNVPSQCNNDFEYGFIFSSGCWIIVVYLMLFLLAKYLYCGISRKYRNKLAHAKNGNIRLNNIKILHWNKGNSKFENKLDELRIILDKFKP